MADPQADVHLALSARIDELSRVALGGSVARDGATSSERIAADLWAVLDVARRDDRLDLLWLSWVAVSTTFPDEARLFELRDRMALLDEEAFGVWFLAETAGLAGAEGAPLRRIRIEQTRVLVDCDFSSRNNRHTGIQRVVRETLPHWVAEHDDVLPVQWTKNSTALQGLDARDRARVLQWNDWSDIREQKRGVSDVDQEPLIVPWGCRIVLPEIAESRQSALLICLARHTPTTLAAVGYDCIPLISPEMMPPNAGTQFLEYLGMLRDAEVVAGISAAATGEFRGFFDATRRPGADVPATVECALPWDVPAVDPRDLQDPDGVPLVLVVGTHEPRKNHLAVLHAAEVLWREGLEFRLDFIGGAGFTTGFHERVDALQSRGRPVAVRMGVPERELWRTYARARFTVFPSLHEGYGLPVAESILSGTPVITSGYGSTLEVAQKGGALVVDPRDDDAIAEAMRLLLVDDERLAELHAAGRAVATADWPEYAAHLWALLVEGDHESVAETEALSA